MSTSTPVPSARDEVRQVVPRLIELTETLLYRYRPEQLEGHLERARANGVTREEIAEVITHVAFDAGWPSAMSGARVAEQVLVGRPA